MRDADLLMLQFAVLGRTFNQSALDRPTSDVGVAFLVNLMLHRLGVFNFAGLTKAPNSDINRYTAEIKQGLFPREHTSEDTDCEDSSLPWTYSPSRDADSSTLLLDEFLHFMIIFTSELPPVAPLDKDGHTNQAKARLRREVIHRLASGSKTHSEFSEVNHVLSHWDNHYLSE